MTTEMSDAPASQPAPETRWYEQAPKDWTGWSDLRERVNASREERENFRNWLAKTEPEGSVAAAAGLLAAGDPERALPALNDATDALGRQLRAEAFLELGRKREACDLLDELYDGSPAGVHAARTRIELCLAMRDVDGAKAALAALNKAGGADADFAKGAEAELAGNYQEALDAYAVAVEADMGNAEATFALARLLDRFGADEDAIAYYSRFADGSLPPHVGALLNLGVLYEDAENHRAARRCFLLVVRADPTNDRARCYLRDAEASMVQFYDESRERNADKQNAVMRIPVTDFELSVRARNCLQRMNIHSLGDLVQRSESELLSFKNFGETSLQEVKDILDMKGLRLGMSPTATIESEAETPAGPEHDGDVRSIKVSELDLSVRSRAALAMLGIGTLGDLESTTETTLLSCKNFGQTSLDEIRSKLRQYNLDLPG
ncbi:MAG: hypothetical protein DHS20C15_00280 [Planctomycetota bacterium]|nr:MAG: hypothetical protein DHS20C15_00280 [Planctomycetota bacterium]